jgi:putative nucleotidyltransferase with HDIG domain
MVADEDFWTAFCEAPAAKAMHHARVGGLLEHSVSCLKIARTLAEFYPVDRDLLFFGAIFHDVGKVRELSWDRGAFAYTTEGRLLGHVVLGERLVASYVAALPGFPEELALRLSHLLVSHQGETEYGSPERPKTLEALLVHLIDNLDARAAMYLETTTNVSPGGWSHHENPLRRALYVPEEPATGSGNASRNYGPLALVVVLVVLAGGEFFLEVVDRAAGFADEAADVAGHLWEGAWAEDHQEDEADDYHLLRTDAEHGSNITRGRAPYNERGPLWVAAYILRPCSSRREDRR